MAFKLKGMSFGNEKQNAARNLGINKVKKKSSGNNNQNAARNLGINKIKKKSSGNNNQNKVQKLTKAPKPTADRNPANPVNANGGKNNVKPPQRPQPPKPGTIKGLTQFQYDMKPITNVGSKYLGKTRGKVRDKIKNYFFTK